MAGFEPLHRPGEAPVFAATFLVAALDRAREEALRAPPAPPPQEADRADAMADAIRAAEEAGQEIGRSAGYAAGLADAAKARETQAVLALEAVARSLGEAREGGRQVAEANAEALARLLLAAMDAALPAAAAREAPELVARLVTALRPALAEEPRLRIRVAPGLGDGLSARLADPAVEVMEEAGIGPADARIEWRGGDAEASLEARRRAVRAALAELGLEMEG